MTLPMHIIAKDKYNLQLPCANCNQLVWRNKRSFEHQRTKQVFCSWLCYLNNKRPASIKCAMCGKEFIPKNRKSLPPNPCCSTRCSGLRQRGENSPHWRGLRRADRGWNWKEKQSEARERDGHICCCLKHNKRLVSYREERCSVDHVIPYRVVMAWNQQGKTFDPNHLDNLISLCRRCHQIKTTGIEPLLLRGNVKEFITAMAKFVSIAVLERVLTLFGDVLTSRSISVASDWERVRRPKTTVRISPKTRGENHWNTKLTVEMVQEIRRQGDKPRKLLAKEFGIPPQYVSQIICRTKWKWVT